MITTNSQVATESAADPLRSRYPRRWPLVLLGLPAAVAIWSGWVGLGQMAGFGLVHPLPGIADGFELNSAITLPIGVEAYSAYALGTWLSARPIARSARRFAAWSSLAALGLGLLGQVVYHLLTAAGYTTAPTPVVVFVACLPVLVLGAGAALHHLLGDPTVPVPEAMAIAASPIVEPEPALAAIEPTPRPTSRAPRARRRRPVPRRLLADYLRDARAHLIADVEPTPGWCRQVTGCSAGTSVKLAAALRAEQLPPEDVPPARLTSTSTDGKENAA
ncbi:MAG TPA: hypothetical protein VIQ30_11830 [Pseudonocardia sp.]